jgi:CheY-like chemotaxis protein
MNKTIRMVVIEDDPDDAYLIERAAKASQYDMDLTFFERGEEALSALAQSEPPHMVLIDINLPGMSGIEVMRHMKQLPSFKGVPLIILTTSSDTKDIIMAYEASGNGFLTKPHNITKLQKLIDAAGAVASIMMADDNDRHIAKILDINNSSIFAVVRG